MKKRDQRITDNLSKHNALMEELISNGMDRDAASTQAYKELFPASTPFRREAAEAVPPAMDIQDRLQQYIQDKTDNDSYRDLFTTLSENFTPKEIVRILWYGLSRGDKDKLAAHFRALDNSEYTPDADERSNH